VQRLEICFRPYLFRDESCGRQSVSHDLLKFRLQDVHVIMPRHNLNNELTCFFEKDFGNVLEGLHASRYRMYYSLINLACPTHCPRCLAHLSKCAHRAIFNSHISKARFDRRNRVFLDATRKYLSQQTSHARLGISMVDKLTTYVQQVLCSRVQKSGRYRTL
jgi:hypothetical protein